jgi:pimeloyl-ACP methyl ester carboxylesterase
MQNLRTHGAAPYRIAVVHGGPGAAGEMAPVARHLSILGGVLEPLQTAATLDGQVDELAGVLEAHGDPPVTLVGFSWGAFLGFLTAARHPRLVKKLILVSSGPFEERYARGIMSERLGRLSDVERTEVLALAGILADPGATGRDAALCRFGAMLARADAFDPLPGEEAVIACDAAVHEAVWPEAETLRRSGRLLSLGKSILCPVVALHGDYDPHPAPGVQEPLSRVLLDFRFILLEDCGHRPWRERRAKDRFYALLEKECAD